MFWIALTVIVTGVIGAAFLPVGAYLFAPSLPKGVREVVTRLLLCLQNLSFGGTVALWRGSGVYELFPLEVDSGGSLYAVLGEDRRVRIEGDRSDLYRFALNPFGIAAEKTDGQLALFEPGEDLDALADGGAPPAYQGYEAFDPVPDADGRKVDLHKVMTLLHGANDNDLAERGMAQALKEKGGLQQQGWIATVVGIVLCMGLGGITTWLAMGGG